MSYFASVNGLPVVGGSLLVPLVGAWTADLVLAGQDVVAGPCTVVIGNLTLQGAVYRTAVYGGQTRARLVGGAGGWRKPVPAQGYGNPAGVALSTVLGDVAAATGETILVAVDTSIGNAFARVAFASSVASDVLWQLLALGFIPSWRVAPDGVTRTDAWPATPVQTPFTPTDARPDEGTIQIATEDYASWLPGCTFSSPLLDTTYTSAGVEYRWGDDGTMRFVVLVGTDGDRIVGPLQRIIASAVSPARFFGRYAYTISNPTPTTIDGSPVDTSLGLPELQNVPLVGSSLASYTPPDGGQARIMFVDGKATQPECVWTQADPNAGPTEITIGPQGSGPNGIARVSDSVVVMFPPLMQIAGVLGAAPFVGVLTITTPAIGAIQTGSSVVKAAQST